MNRESNSVSATEAPCLDRVIFDFHCAVDRGERPRQADWLARYPHLESGLRSYFDDLDGISFLPLAARASDGLQPGAVLGDYELLERLGQGGQGSVWKARLRTAREIVAAIKTMHGPSRDDAAAVERFRNDARSLARMTHPHIVRTSYIGEVDGRWYIVMELVEGGSLADHLDALRGDLRQVAAMMEKIARAIHHAHTRADGVIHLDLKPANILLTADGEPKVTDFGLAIRGERSRRNEPPGGDTSAVPETSEERSATFARAGIVGTLPYLSPEMAAGRWDEVSTLSDIYGLGAVLYALLTGKPPIPSSTPSETLERIVAGDITPPRQWNRSVDRELNAVCLKCLAREPARRYGSADAVANDLRRWLERRATLAGGRPSPLREARFWARRHPGTLVIAVAFLIAIIGLAVYQSLETSRRENAIKAAQLARQLDRELGMIRTFTSRLADNESLRLALRQSRETAAPRARQDAIQAQLDRIDTRLLFDVAGGDPLANVLVLDPNGIELADTASHGRTLLPHSFAVRDYVRAFEDRRLPTSHVHVARAFHSIKDRRQKIAVSTRVWDTTGELLGFVVANFTTGHRLLGFDLCDETEDVAVLCPCDTSDPARSSAEPPTAPWSYAVVISRDYGEALTDKLVPIEAPELSRFQREPELPRLAFGPSGGQLVDFHRVGATDLLVVSRRPAPWPLTWLPRSK